MQDYRTVFEGKKITVMGLGLLGRAAGDAAFLAECGAQLTVTDMKTEEELTESVAQLKRYSNITFHFGGHVQEDFTGCDMVLKAAGVPLDSPYIKAAHDAGVSVVMSTALFAKYATEAGAKVVGITGTRGKSTVTYMIFEALQKAGKKVLLGGNVRGVSTLAMLPGIESDTIAVLELDSWQLQGFGDLHVSPYIAVFTNLMPDHQNYYHSMDAYFADKANIFKYQKEEGILICGKGIEERIKAARPLAAPLVPPPIPDDWTLRVPGTHNRENAALAAGALRAIGLPESEIKASLESFEGVEGRLQFVREINGVKIYNDNNSTTPEATIAALRALNTMGKNIILIMGGSDKGLDMSVLIAEIGKSCKKAILLAGTGTERIKSDLSDAPVFDSLAAAFDAARRVVAPGDIILFSPALASFGMFKNEYDRGDQFMNIVKDYENFWSGGFLYNPEQKTVLLHKRDGNTRFNPNKWGLFGGTGEAGETPEHTFIREMGEELSLKIEMREMVHLQNYDLEDQLGKRHYIYYVLRNIPKQEMVLGEGADFDWIPLDVVFDYDLTLLARNVLRDFGTTQNYV